MILLTKLIIKPVWSHMVEVHISCTRGDLTLFMQAIVMEDLGCDVIRGAIFFEKITLSAICQTMILLSIQNTVSRMPQTSFQPPLFIRQVT